MLLALSPETLHVFGRKIFGVIGETDELKPSLSCKVR